MKSQIAQIMVENDKWLRSKGVVMDDVVVDTLPNPKVKINGRIQTTEPIGKEFDSWKRKYGKKHEKDIESAKKVADDYVLGPLDPIECAM
jgi:hypothetical protein